MKIVQKTLTFFLCFFLLCNIPARANAEENRKEFKNGDYTYIVLEDGTAEITYYNGKEINLYIPAQLDGHSVTSIGDSAFSSCSSLTSITIPDSVTSIGDSAFVDCPENLTVTVGRNSYAKQYCIDNNMNYIYPDSNDWLNN